MLQCIEMTCTLYFMSSAIVLLIIILIVKIYLKWTTGWCTSKTCLINKTAIITEASTGIGYETALDFAKRGARVIMASRDLQKAENARTKIIEETGNNNICVKFIDLNSFDTVRAFAKDINDTEDRLDILVNNAGIMLTGDQKSKDGHLSGMQVNYFSSFLLTNLLIGLMKKSKPSRIINVSSSSAQFAYFFNCNNLDKFPGDILLYFHSKLCNILFTMELSKKLEGTGVTVYAVHPGTVRTEIFRYANVFLKTLFAVNPFFKTCEEGAQTIIYCVITKGIEQYSGEFFEECHRVEPYNTATVMGRAKKLWEVTEAMLQLKPEDMHY